ncbi:MAG: hypothetical protein KJO02_01235, partial [Erythrobacter sp.]|nr:hypothetical protein [Erythrobacter sp.]
TRPGEHGTDEQPDRGAYSRQRHRGRAGGGRRSVLSAPRMRRPRDPNLSRRIAVEAARLLADSGLESLEHAKRRAALRLGCRDRAQWPENLEIEQALREHQRLFLADRQPEALHRLRLVALEAMQAFAEFRPRLVGAALEGTADVHSGVRLLVSASSPEDVAFVLTDRHIPWLAAEVTLRFAHDKREPRPCFSFQAGDTKVELVVMQRADQSDPPRDSATGLPLRTADRTDVAALISADP